MLKVSVGASTRADAYAAGREAAEKALVDNARLALVYSSCAYDQGALLAGVADVLPKGADVVGCTSFTGVLTPEGFISGEAGYVAVMTLADDEMAFGVAGSAKLGDARTTGQAVAKAALASAQTTERPAYAYMVAPPGEEETYLRGVEDVIGRVPVFGGSAADNTVEGKWKVLSGRAAYSDGLGLALFFTNKKPGLFYGGEYAETGKYGIVTKISGKRVLAEIDGEPALKKYAAWRGLDPAALQGLALLGATICGPLGVKDPIGRLTAIRHPMVGTPENTMAIGNDLAVGTAVMLMESDADRLIASVTKAMRTVDARLGAKPGAYLLVHCGGRRGGIGDRIGEAAAAIKAAAEGVPFIGVFTFGEYGFEDWSANTCGGLMLSFAGLAK